MENEEDFKIALYVHVSAKLKEERSQYKRGDRVVFKKKLCNIVWGI